MNKQASKEYQITASTKFIALAENEKEAKEAAKQHLKYKMNWECPGDILTIQIKEQK